MITLTDNAIKAVSRFVRSAPARAEGLRITVTGGGCSGFQEALVIPLCGGFQYGIKLEASAATEDTVIDSGGVKLFVDPTSLPMIDGVVVDFVDSLDGSGFKFTNPNVKHNCGCGKSFSA